MKKYPEIKWSEAARNGIKEQLIEMKGTIKGKEWLNSLPPSTKARIEELKKIPKANWKVWHKQIREE